MVGVLFWSLELITIMDFYRLFTSDKYSWHC